MDPYTLEGGAHRPVGVGCQINSLSEGVYISPSWSLQFPKRSFYALNNFLQHKIPQRKFCEKIFFISSYPYIIISTFDHKIFKVIQAFCKINSLRNYVIVARTIWQLKN